MSCVILSVDAKSPHPEAIARAARMLQAGGLVAFPTETVYGLGANALDAAAVARIFAAKGRPASNPIIVHVADVEGARSLVADWPPTARILAGRFWPGPLTLVLPRSEMVPDLLTAGGSTVAIRVPAHPVALALLQACEVPIAAPSANRSTEISPTRAEHVLRSLADRIDLLLDGGPTTRGLESTVLDVTTNPPRLLRPGLITQSQLQALIGRVAGAGAANAEPVRSPGQMQRHYAPRTAAELSDHGQARVEELCAQGARVGWLTHREEEGETPAMRIVLPGDPAGYASGLYAALHQLDAAGLERIVIDRPPLGDDWLAIHDRLNRAV
jgi:L-threonylcarbamoyladenylate synthase